MDKRIEKYWVEKYPNLFAGYHKGIYKSPMAWGVSCGHGWFELLDQLWKDLSKIEGVVLAQVKEKFGGLRVYIEPIGRFKDNIDYWHDGATELINEAKAKSFETCEMCGKPGKLRTGSWRFTLCDKCYALDQNDTLSAEEKWGASDKMAKKIAKQLGLRTKCETERDHIPDLKYANCLACGAVRNKGTNFKWV